MKLGSKSRALVAILSLTLGLMSSALAEPGPSTPTGDGGWIAAACHDPANAGRTPDECCATKCGYFNDTNGNSYGLPGITDCQICQAACLAAYYVAQ